MNVKKTISFLIRVILSGLLLLLVFVRIDFAKMINVLLHVNHYYIGASFIFIFAAFCLNVYKWQRLINGVIGIGLSYFDLLRFSLIGFFYSLFVPGGQFIGEAFKALRVIKKSDKKSELVFSIFVDRITGFIALGLLLLYGFLQNIVLWSNFISTLALVIGLMISGIGALLFFNDSFSRQAVRIADHFSFFKKYVITSFLLYANNKREVFTATMLSIIVHLLMTLSVYYITIAFGLHISFSYLMWVYLIVGITLFLPISYAGFGPREWTFVYFFSINNVALEQAFATSLVFIGLNMVVAFFGAWFEIKSLLRKNYLH